MMVRILVLYSCILGTYPKVIKHPVIYLEVNFLLAKHPSRPLQVSLLYSPKVLFGNIDIFIHKLFIVC